ncbi:hypothetical protein IMSHALPRED_001737 [Imshaugia aleurites]|uniref:F-box domain-containing protein n=1 Tax=Imshaugia aleurites TaxID=172621 RepID=A0A8H3PGY9_9LECA|nr:hypothetical protein IMSHALPRED_001737 [Imshaugia aleurites]
MVWFSDLSKELILLIWDLVELEDIYSFSTVTKEVYLLTYELLREHFRLKKRLTIISNVGLKPGEHGVFGRILKEVLLNPQAALYPSILKVDIGEVESGERGEHFHGTVSESDLELFKQVIRDTTNESEEDMEEFWLADIDEGREEPLVALLLLLLPNLREIDFGTYLTGSLCMNIALRTIMDDENSCPLRKLRSVNLRCTGNDDDDMLDFELVRLFAILPSVTSIYGYNVGSYPDDLPQNSIYTFEKTNVTDLTFVQCRIDPKSMFEFLSTTENLQIFFYSPRGDSRIFDPFWIRTALLANARYTLKALTILADGYPRSFIGSLEEFYYLESVKMDVWLLIADPPTWSHKPSTILPSSIVNIMIHIKHLSDRECCRASIRDIADRPTHFESLKTIVVVCAAGIPASSIFNETVSLVLKGRGVRLSFATEDEPDDAEIDFDGESHTSSISQALQTSS